MTPIWAKTGDVFFTRSSSWLGRAIRWAQTDPGEKNGTWANHTGVVVEDGWIGANDPATVVEALWKTRKGRLKLNGIEVRVFRLKRELTPLELINFRLRADSYVGATYGWWKLFGHLADRVLFKGKKRISSLFFIDNRPICSYLAAHIFAGELGVTFGMDPDAADPDEMMDFCIEHPEIWQEVK